MSQKWVREYADSTRKNSAQSRNTFASRRLVDVLPSAKCVRDEHSDEVIAVNEFICAPERTTWLSGENMQELTTSDINTSSSSVLMRSMTKRVTSEMESSPDKNGHASWSSRWIGSEKGTAQFKCSLASSKRLSLSDL